MSDTVPKELIADLGLVQLPTQEKMARLYERAEELARLELDIAKDEEALQRKKDDRTTLRQKTLPEMFDEIGTDRLGVPGFAADVVLTSRVHASIAADWDEEKRARGFAEIERLNSEAMIKVTVEVQFDKKEFELAARLVEHIRGLNWLGGHTVSVRKGVAWNTLTKWVGEMIDKRVPLDLQAVGGSLTRECNIVWRRRK
jgi:hypothetical protein